MKYAAPSSIPAIDCRMLIDGWVGTLGEKVTIWTRPENKALLIQALDSKQLPDNASTIFDIVDGRYFQPEDRSVINTDCPKDATWYSGIVTDKNGLAGRKIESEFFFRTTTSPPKLNGLRDYDADWRMWGTSYKYVEPFFGWWKYKTDHCGSINFQWATFQPNSPIHTENENWINTCVKCNYFRKALLVYRNQPLQFISANGCRLLNTVPGSSGNTGAALSHQGMGGLHTRVNCQ